MKNDDSLSAMIIKRLLNEDYNQRKETSYKELSELID